MLLVLGTLQSVNRSLVWLWEQENSSDAKLQTMRHYNFFLMHVHATLPERIGHV